MATTKIDSLLLGRGNLATNAGSVAIFTANNVVDYWSILTSYSQYNIVEQAGAIWRSKVNANLGNNPVSSPNHWEKLYSGTKDGDFAFITGTGATIMQRQGGLWLVFGNHPSEIAYYDEPMDVVVGAPANDNEIMGPISPGAFITIPLDSRESNTIENYIVGSGDIEVRLNGAKLVLGDDWLETGLPTANSNIVEINIPLVVGDRLVFRRHRHKNLTGYGGGAGAGADLLFYDETIDVVVGAPANDNEATGPIIAGTTLTLPFDSREANATEFYIVGSGDLEVRLNGNKLILGEDWSEIGIPTNNSTTIQIDIPLDVGDEVTFRRLHAEPGSGGGGGGGSLQAAYTAGNSIIITPGIPFTVTGSPGKCAVFNGDIDVTGVIDPKGITFSREVSDPLPSQDGLWVNSLGELNFKQVGVGNSNISMALGGAVSATAVLITIKNDSGFAINQWTPVCLDINGKLKVVSVNSEADAESFLGLAAANIPNGASGQVIISGKIENISTVIPFRAAIFVSSTGTVTSVKPEIGVSGFVSGDWVLKIGVISSNVTTPANKDIIITPINRGQL